MGSPLDRQTRRRRRRSLPLAALVTVGALVAATGPATAATAKPTKDPNFVDRGSALAISAPRSTSAPGYTVIVDKSPFRVTTVRGGRTVLATSSGDSPTSAPVKFVSGGESYYATKVTSSSWRDGALTLDLATSDPGRDVIYVITPEADRYRVHWTVTGSTPVTSVGGDYRLASAGHWYGEGETVTPKNGPYYDQPWPLESGQVIDDEMGPASYYMTDPFWFTSKSTGMWVDTGDVMHVRLNADHDGLGSFVITRSDTYKATIFVESTPRAVYTDYIGITGTPENSDVTARQYFEPLWNTWAEFYVGVSEKKVLRYARGIKSHDLPGHSIQIDDGWMSHYGDFTFNSKFPTPQKMSQQIHNMGFDLGLWVTFWINKDAKNYQYAADHGYLLRSKEDPDTPCTVTWWNGTAGIIDLANPAARKWLLGKLRMLEQKYDVDGFKFDVRFFDDRCAPYPGHTARDYLKIGANIADQFNLQGKGLRVSWTGSQRYGFASVGVDKGTGWPSLRAAVTQSLAISTIGYPFTETDMIGGSNSDPPPTKKVLVRWAGAASVMPLMYSSTSPVGTVTNPYTGQSRTYDRQTIKLYKRAIHRHQLLTPYILAQVHRAVSTGEPIMKPIFFDYPQDQASYTVDDEWLLGDSLLAAPILSDTTTRDINVPAGHWFDVMRHRVVKGPVTLHAYKATLGQVPLFVRLGTPKTGVLMSALAPGHRHD